MFLYIAGKNRSSSGLDGTLYLDLYSRVYVFEKKTPSFLKVCGTSSAEVGKGKELNWRNSFWRNLRDNGMKSYGEETFFKYNTMQPMVSGNSQSKILGIGKSSVFIRYIKSFA